MVLPARKRRIVMENVPPPVMLAYRMMRRPPDDGLQDPAPVRKRAVRVVARRVRDEFFPKSLIWPDEIKGLDSLMAEAVSLKFIPAPLSKEQLGELIQIQGKK